MRRTLMLGAVTPVVVLGFLAWTQTILLAQSPAPRAASTQAPPSAAPTGTFDVPFGSDGSSPALDALPIRLRFIELSKKKAYALNEEQLKREVDVMEKQVKELEAWAKADEAVRLLQEVVDKHPNTEAADAANGAIRHLEERHKAALMGLGPVPGPDRRELAPIPDPGPPDTRFQSRPSDVPIKKTKKIS